MDSLAGTAQSTIIIRDKIINSMGSSPANLTGVLSRFYKSCMINLITILETEASAIGHSFNSLIIIDDPTNIHLKGFIKKAIEKTSKDFGLKLKAGEINAIYTILKDSIRERLQEILWHLVSLENLKTILTRNIDLDLTRLFNFIIHNRSLKEKFSALLKLSPSQWKSILNNVINFTKTAETVGKTSVAKNLLQGFFDLFKKNARAAATATAAEEVAEEAVSTHPPKAAIYSRSGFLDTVRKSKGGVLLLFLDLRGTSHGVTLSDIDYAKKEREFANLGISPEAHFKAYEFFNSSNVAKNTRILFDIKTDPLKHTNAYLSLAVAFEDYNSAIGKKYVIEKNDWQKISAIYLTLSLVAKISDKPLKFSASQLAHLYIWYKNLNDYEFKKRYPLMRFLIGYINSNYNFNNTAELQALGIKNLEKIEGGFSTGDLLMQIAFKKIYEIYQLNKNLKIQKSKKPLD